MDGTTGGRVGGAGEAPGCRLRVTMIDWEYPEDGEVPDPAILDLEDASELQMLVLALGNGVVVEARIQAESADALDAVRALLEGVGSCVAHEPSEEDRSRLWLHDDGLECYRQGEDPGGFFFLDPAPRPGAFPARP